MDCSHTKNQTKSCRNTYRQKSKTPKKHQPLTTAIKRLSFSFYAQDTIKKSKQIILDNCDLSQQLPLPTCCPPSRPPKSNRLSRQPSKLSKSKKKNSNLEMEKYFYEQKYDQIELVPTNASHLDYKCTQSNLNKSKTPIEGLKCKSKKYQAKPGSQNRKCQTVLGRRSAANDLKFQQKSTKRKLQVK